MATEPPSLDELKSKKISGGGGTFERLKPKFKKGELSKPEYQKFQKVAKDVPSWKKYQKFKQRKRAKEKALSKGLIAETKKGLKIQKKLTELTKSDLKTLSNVGFDVSKIKQQRQKIKQKQKKFQKLKSKFESANLSKSEFQELKRMAKNLPSWKEYKKFKQTKPQRKAYNWLKREGWTEDGKIDWHKVAGHRGKKFTEYSYRWKSPPQDVKRHIKKATGMSEKEFQKRLDIATLLRSNALKREDGKLKVAKGFSELDYPEREMLRSLGFEVHAGAVATMPGEEWEQRARMQRKLESPAFQAARAEQVGLLKETPEGKLKMTEEVSPKTLQKSEKELLKGAGFTEEQIEKKSLFEKLKNKHILQKKDGKWTIPTEELADLSESEVEEINKKLNFNISKEKWRKAKKYEERQSEISSLASAGLIQTIQTAEGKEKIEPLFKGEWRPAVQDITGVTKEQWQTMKEYKEEGLTGLESVEEIKEIEPFLEGKTYEIKEKWKKQKEIENLSEKGKIKKTDKGKYKPTFEGRWEKDIKKVFPDLTKEKWKKQKTIEKGIDKGLLERKGKEVRLTKPVGKYTKKEFEKYLNPIFGVSEQRWKGAKSVERIRKEKLAHPTIAKGKTPEKPEKPPEKLKGEVGKGVMAGIASLNLSSLSPFTGKKPEGKQKPAVAEHRPSQPWYPASEGTLSLKGKEQGLKLTPALIKSRQTIGKAKPEESVPSTIVEEKQRKKRLKGSLTGRILLATEDKPFAIRRLGGAVAGPISALEAFPEAGSMLIPGVNYETPDIGELIVREQMGAKGPEYQKQITTYQRRPAMLPGAILGELLGFEATMKGVGKVTSAFKTDIAKGLEEAGEVSRPAEYVEKGGELRKLKAPLEFETENPVVKWGMKKVLPEGKMPSVTAQLKSATATEDVLSFQKGARIRPWGEKVKLLPSEVEEIRQAQRLSESPMNLAKVKPGKGIKPIVLKGKKAPIIGAEEVDESGRVTRRVILAPGEDEAFVTGGRLSEDVIGPIRERGAIGVIKDEKAIQRMKKALNIPEDVEDISSLKYVEEEVPEISKTKFEKAFEKGLKNIAREEAGTFMPGRRPTPTAPSEAKTIEAEMPDELSLPFIKEGGAVSKGITAGTITGLRGATAGLDTEEASKDLRIPEKKVRQISTELRKRTKEGERISPKIIEEVSKKTEIPESKVRDISRRIEESGFKPYRSPFEEVKPTIEREKIGRQPFISPYSEEEIGGRGIQKSTIRQRMEKKPTEIPKSIIRERVKERGIQTPKPIFKELESPTGITEVKPLLAEKTEERPVERPSPITLEELRGRTIQAPRTVQVPQVKQEQEAKETQAPRQIGMPQFEYTSPFKQPTPPKPWPVPPLPRGRRRRKKRKRKKRKLGLIGRFREFYPRNLFGGRRRPKRRKKGKRRKKRRPRKRSKVFGGKPLTEQLKGSKKKKSKKSKKKKGSDVFDHEPLTEDLL